MLLVLQQADIIVANVLVRTCEPQLFVSTGSSCRPRCRSLLHGAVPTALQVSLARCGRPPGDHAAGLSCTAWSPPPDHAAGLSLHGVVLRCRSLLHGAVLLS